MRTRMKPCERHKDSRRSEICGWRVKREKARNVRRAGHRRTREARGGELPTGRWSSTEWTIKRDHKRPYIESPLLPDPVGLTAGRAANLQNTIERTTPSVFTSLLDLDDIE